MISFLVGSGFSIKEGVPGVGTINTILKTLRADQIFLGSDQSAFLLREGEKDPNGWFPDNVKDRKFVVELIQFYILNVIKNPTLLTTKTSTIIIIFRIQKIHTQETCKFF